MTGIDWQLAIVGIVVAVAAAFVVYRVWKLIGGTAGCSSGCGACPARPHAAPTLVSLTSLDSPPRTGAQRQ